MSEPNADERAVVVPILTIANAAATLPQGTFLRHGGHFYPSAPDGTHGGTPSTPYVFVNAGADGTLREPLAVPAGTTLSRIALVPPVHTLVTVHPMTYRCHPKSTGASYYLPSGTAIAAGDDIPAFSDVFNAPPVSVKIVSLEGGSGTLVYELPLTADGNEQPVNVYLNP